MYLFDGDLLNVKRSKSEVLELSVLVEEGGELVLAFCIITVRIHEEHQGRFLVAELTNGSFFLHEVQVSLSGLVAFLALH